MISSDPSCLFCKIIAQEVPSTKIYENESVYAFLDINPINLGHTLVVPKNHSENIHDISEEDATALMQAGKKIASALKKGLHADGVNLIMNNEKASGQIVFHAHLHIIPRLEADGFHHWRGKEFSKEEIEKAGEKIKNEIPL
ncbi:MAG: HIT family protein [Patescibacteria group bacterium]